MNVTPEMIEAWRTLQNAAAGAYRLQPQVRDAINVLDNSNFMVPIEDTEYESKAAQSGDINADDTLDPGNWGDTTREDMAAHQTIGKDAILARRVDEL